MDLLPPRPHGRILVLLSTTFSRERRANIHLRCVLVSTLSGNSLETRGIWQSAGLAPITSRVFTDSAGRRPRSAPARDRETVR